MSHQLKCDLCGRSAEPHHKFCIGCGNEMNFQKVKCPQCGISCPAKNKFCNKCGYQINKEEEEEEEMEELPVHDRVESLDEIISMTLPDKEELNEVIEKYDVIRKNTVGLDLDKLLTMYINVSTSIYHHHTSRATLIKGLIGFREALKLSTTLKKKEIESQLKYTLAFLNLQYGGLIPLPKHRRKYYEESYKFTRELVNLVEQGRITDERKIKIFLLQSELYKRMGNLKRAFIISNTVQKLSVEYPEIIVESKLHHLSLLIASARFEEAQELMSGLSDIPEKLKGKFEILEAKFLSALDDDKAELSYINLIKSKHVPRKDKISATLNLTNYYLSKSPNKALETFEGVFSIKLEPAEEQKYEKLKLIIDDYVLESNVSIDIKLNKIQTIVNDAYFEVKEFQGKEMWEEMLGQCRIIHEYLENYGDELDPDKELLADINFRRGLALFKLEADEIAYSYFDMALDLCKTGIGDPVQHPTIIKHLIEVQIKLHQYKEIYENAQIGLELSNNIAHSGLIQYFTDVIKNFNPERLEKLHRFNALMSVAINQMSHVDNLYTLFRLLGLNPAEISGLDNLYVPILMIILRTDLGIPLLIQQGNIQIQNTMNRRLMRSRVGTLMTEPLRIIDQLPGFKLFTGFGQPYLDKPIPLNFMSAVLIGVIITLEFKKIGNRRITQGELQRIVLDRLINLKEEFIAIVLLIGIIKYIEGGMRYTIDN